MVRTIKLNEGKSIPAIAWGNGTGGMSKSGQKAVDMGEVALKAGIKHIDTAQIYGTEKETGLAIKQAGIDRADVWVTTKIGGSHSIDQIRSSIKESLDKLTFTPDLLLIHNPFVPEEGKIGEFWKVLEDLVEDGTLKGTSLGVSNFRPKDLEEVFKAGKTKPVVNQLEYHPYVLTHLQPVLNLHAKHGIVVESYGPLTPLLRHPTGGPIKPILTRIAQRLSKETGKEVDEASVLLLWTVQMGVVAVSSSGNPKNLEKMAAVHDLPDLTAEEVKEIEEAGRKVHFRHYKEHMTKEFAEPDLPQDL